MEYAKEMNRKDKPKETGSGLCDGERGKSLFVTQCAFSVFSVFTAMMCWDV